MIIDAHTHLWQEGFLSDAFHEESAKIWAAQKEGRTPEMVMDKLINGVVDPDGQMFLNNMDNAGVDISFIHTLDAGKYWCGHEPKLSLEEQFGAYEQLHEKFSGRLYFLGCADPRRPDCVAIMEKGLEKKGFVGCGELVPEGFNINDDVAQPLMQFCTDKGLPVAIHTRTGTGIDISSADKTNTNPCHPEHVIPLMDRYPDLVVLLSHIGWPVWWKDACEVAKGRPNCYLELSNWSLNMAQPEKLVEQLATMRDMVGADHIIFGSDQPSGRNMCVDKPFLKGWVDFFKELPSTASQHGYSFTPEEIELMLGKNAARVFNI